MICIVKRLLNWPMSPPITTLAEQAHYTELVARQVQDHTDNIPVLAQGFKESKRFMSDAQIGAFLDRAIRNRICMSVFCACF